VVRDVHVKYFLQFSGWMADRIASRFVYQRDACPPALKSYRLVPFRELLLDQFFQTTLGEIGGVVPFKTKRGRSAHISRGVIGCRKNPIDTG
jgi:hypothetical protein